MGGGTPYKGINPITPGDSDIVIPAKTLIKDLLTILAVQTEVKTVTPSASPKIVTPSADKYLSKVTVSGDADLKATNIKKGVNVFGVIGTLVGATDLLTEFGCTKYAIDEFVKTGTELPYKTQLPHSLGEKPKFTFILADITPPQDSNWYVDFAVIISKEHVVNNNAKYMTIAQVKSYYGGLSSRSNCVDAANYITTAYVVMHLTDNLLSGATYKMITMA